MNAMFNNNFLVGMLLARDLPRQEQFLAGLVAGQMPANSPVAPLFLQPIVSRLASEERGRESAESENTSLRQLLEVELPAETVTAQLRVPGVTGVGFTRVDGSDRTSVDSSGKVGLPAVGNEIRVAINVGGTSREVTIVRGQRPSAEQTLARSAADSDLAMGDLADRPPSTGSRERGAQRR